MTSNTARVIVWLVAVLMATAAPGLLVFGYTWQVLVIVAWGCFVALLMSHAARIEK